MPDEDPLTWEQIPNPMGPMNQPNMYICPTCKSVCIDPEAHYAWHGLPDDSVPTDG